MDRAVSAVLCVACTISLVSATAAKGELNVSPVQKVLSLLDDMAGKVEADLKASSHNFELSAKACGDDAVDKEHAIADSKSEIEELSAAVQAGQASSVELDTEIQDLASQISENEAELSTTAEVRKKERAEFEASEKELVETVDALAKAEATLKRGTSFAQISKAQQAEIRRVIKGFGMVVEGAWVSHAQKRSLKSFLQQHEDDDDDGEDDSALEDGGSIIDTIAGMLEKAEGQLSDLRKAEAEGLHEFQMLSMGTNNQLESLKSDLAESKGKKQVVLESVAQNQKDLSMETKSLEEMQSLLKELKRDCQSKAVDFESETKDGNAELEALKKAKAILSKKFAPPSFLQLSSRVQVHAQLRSKTRSKSWYSAEDGDTRKEEALRALHSLGERLHSTALLSLAQRAAADPFAKVRAMIEEMVAKLLSEAAEEADQKAFCDKEIGESKSSQADKQQKFNTVDARIGRLNARETRLAEDIAKIAAEVADIDTAMREATEVRTQAKAAFKVAAKDFAESQEACSSAITELREYYEGGASFLQTRAKTRSRSASAEDLDASDQDSLEGGEGIIGMLEVAESDFATMLAEAKAMEEKEQDDYEKLVADNRVLKATKLAEGKAKESDQKATRSSVHEFSQDREGLAQELSAVDDYLSKLKPQCETVVPTYAEIKARREKEIEGLKEALEVLDG